jgi:hypothetical protein
VLSQDEKGVLGEVLKQKRQAGHGETVSALCNTVRQIAAKKGNPNAQITNGWFYNTLVPSVPKHSK